MHTNMHMIQASAYRIHCVHMTYEQMYICLYVLVCVCITSYYELYPMHMCMYVRYI